MDVDSAVATVRSLVVREERRPDDRSAVGGWLQRLCRVGARELPADGVGVSVVDLEGGLLTAAASSPRSARIEELQFTMGEGPCLAAFESRRPVLVEDLDRLGGLRWPGYATAAHDEGVRAVFAFPLQLGVARLGALDVYRAVPGSLSTHALTLARACARLAMEALLDPSVPDEMGFVDPEHGLAPGFRFEVYQAQGMVMVQLGVTAEESLLRLRAHAFATGRPISEVAQDVIHRRLVLQETDG